MIWWSANKEEVKEEEEKDTQPNSPTQGSRGPINGTAPHAILHHISISSIGQVYEVEKLNHLANKRVVAIVDDENDKSWLPALPAAAKATLERQRPVDRALRDIIASAVARNLAPVVQRPDFLSLKTAPGFLMAVLSRCARRFLAFETAQAACKTEVDRLRTRLDASEAYAKATKEKLDQEQRRGAESRAASANAKEKADGLKTRLDKIDEILKTLDKTDECRNCHREFAGWVDDQRGVLRCKECACKHVS